MRSKGWAGIRRFGAMLVTQRIKRCCRGAERGGDVRGKYTTEEAKQEIAAKKAITVLFRGLAVGRDLGGKTEEFVAAVFESQ